MRESAGWGTDRLEPGETGPNMRGEVIGPTSIQCTAGASEREPAVRPTAGLTPNWRNVENENVFQLNLDVGRYDNDTVVCRPCFGERSESSIWLAVRVCAHPPDGALMGRQRGLLRLLVLVIWHGVLRLREPPHHRASRPMRSRI